MMLAITEKVYRNTGAFAEWNARQAALASRRTEEHVVSLEEKIAALKAELAELNAKAAKEAP